jgi:tripartite-type tricarboxylate transporter receptor subunit TctC
MALLTVSCPEPPIAHPTQLRRVRFASCLTDPGRSSKRDAMMNRASFRVASLEASGAEVTSVTIFHISAIGVGSGLLDHLEVGEGNVKFCRRQILHLLTGAIALPAAPRFARAQAYPTRPVRMIVGFAAGGSTDISARLIAQWLTERLGQAFVVENRPGAGSNIAAEAVVNAPADGYTLLVGATANAINATLYDKLNFNFMRDTVPVAGIIRVPNVMEVNLSVPARSVPEFITYAKANPGKISMASAGVGASSHASGELFKFMTGINMVHVPYRGVAPALADLIGGQVQVLFDTMPNTIEYIKAGKLRALAVTTTTRNPAMPDLPSVAEFLPGYESSAWYGVSAPKGTPADIVEKLNKEINAGLSDPKLGARLADLGGIPLQGSSADFGKLIADETEKWGKVIRAANIKAE